MTTTQDKNSQAAITPGRALQLLKEGNRRFMAGRGEERELMAQVNATRGGQWPFAIILGCIDSRVPSELIFDAGIGDLFNARVAGNFVNGDILGSMEFACELAGAKLVVVLGHTQCGAIKGACDGVELGNLTGMLARLKPAVEGTSSPVEAAERTSANGLFVRDVTVRNVRMALSDIRERSEVLEALERSGAIRLIGALYDVETGSVEFLD
jgi:carbonic anhydrase